VRSKSGETLGSTAIIKDVTEDVELEHKIYNAEKLASIGTLAAGVAHEINNPLSIILGFVELLEDKFKEGSPEYSDLKIIEQNAQNAKLIIDNMLGFARVTEGFADTVDVPGAVNTVVNIVKSTLRGDKIEVVVDVPENLPDIKGDPREIQQVLLNLINNATAAMASDGGTLTVSASRRGGWVDIAVADTGAGIPGRYKMKIFDPFFTTKKVGEGTGLGLSLCYGIVHKYGGTITFESRTREDGGGPSGSTFVVSLPVAEPDEKK
jgi:signal transduction histidine kinase